MLTYKEIKTVEELCDNLSDVKRRDTLNKLLFEYMEYSRSGSPEDCAQRKEWMEMSYEDIRMSFNSTIKALRDEVSDIKADYLLKSTIKKTKKTGRPRKKTQED